MDHHAYLLLGEKGARDAYLKDLLDKEGISLVGNPDAYVFENETLSVDDARSLSQRSLGKAFGSKKIFVIDARRWSPESQNALLKTFEEPPQDTHFFVMASEDSNFLPTLLSRMRKIRIEGVRSAPSDEAQEFLQASHKDRLVFVKKFVDDERDLAAFLDSLLVLMRSQGTGIGSLEQVFAVRAFANDPAASARLILEHLSLVLG